MNYTTKKIMINMTKAQLQNWIDQHKSEIDAYIASGGTMTDYIKANFDVRSWKNLINVGGENEKYLTTSYKELTELPTFNDEVLIGDVTDIILPAKPEGMEVDTQYALCVSKDEDGNYTYNWINIEETVAELKTQIETETTRATEAEKTLQNNIDEKSEVEVSTQKVSGAADIYSINVDGTDYNLVGEGSGTPDAYLKSANVDGNKLTLTKKDDTTVEYTPAIPTKTSELTNDSGFLTEHQSLENYYTKDETYPQSEIDQKIATGTGLYLGWLENNAEELPSESEIGTWIINNWSSLQPSAVEQVTNNDYIFIYFSTQYVYWRVKVVTEATGKVLPSAVTWKKDLEFDDDIVGLIEQVETNTKAIQTEATTRSEADTTLQTNIDNCEKTANKVTSLSSESTDTQYPTAKCVYDLVGNVETILQTLNTGTGAK